MMDYLIKELSLVPISDIIVFIGSLAFLLYVLYYHYHINDNFFNDFYDYKTVVVSTLNYTTNERIDNSIILSKEKTENSYILSLTKKQGYYISFHVCGENIIIGTNVDKKCKPNDNTVNIISLPNSIKIEVIDPID